MTAELNPDPEGLHASSHDLEPELHDALYKHAEELGYRDGSKRDLIVTAINDHLEDARSRTENYLPGKKIAVTAGFMAVTAIAAAIGYSKHKNK